MTKLKQIEKEVRSYKRHLLKWATTSFLNNGAGRLSAWELFTNFENKIQKIIKGKTK